MSSTPPATFYRLMRNISVLMEQALVSFFMEDLAVVPIKNKREIKIMDTRRYVKFW